MKNYKKIKQLSDGHFSNVFLVTDARKNKYILKEYKAKGKEQSYLEYLFLSSIDLPNVVKVHDHEIIDGKTTLLLDYIEGEHVEFTNFQKMKTSAVNKFFYELSLTIAKVHSSGICLNDLKPDNIIIKKGSPYLIDFGLATLNGYSDNFIRGTIAYSAPEKIERFTNHFAGEVFSLGILCFYIQTGKTPADEFSFDEYKKLLKDQNKFKEYLLENEIDEFTIRMLSIDPVERPSILEIADYFSNGIKKNVDPEFIRMQIDNYIFPSQIRFVKDILKSKSRKPIKYNYQDEIEKIINISALWIESSGKRLIVIDESLFISDPETFIDQISDITGQLVKNKNDLISTLSSSKSAYKFFIKKDTDRNIVFLEELYGSLSDEDCFVFLRSVESDIDGVSKNEYNDLLTKISMQEALIKNAALYIPQKPYFVRLTLLDKITKKKVNTDPNLLTTLLGVLDISLPFVLLDDVFSTKLKEFLNKGILNHELLLIGDKIKYNGNGLNLVKPDKKIINKLKKASEKREEYLILGKIAEIEGRKAKEVFKYYENYVISLSNKEHYFTAFEFAGFLKDEYPDKYFNYELKKKYAFLARMSGEHQISINAYNALEKDSSDYDKAVISTDKAVVLQEIKEYDKALECYEKAIKIFLKLDKLNDYLRTMNNQGSALFELKKFREAEKVFNLLLLKAQQNNKPQFITMSFLNLAAINVSLAEWKKALHFSNKSKEIATQYKKLRIIVLSDQYRIISNFGLGNYDEVSRSISSIIGNENIKENKTLYFELLQNLLYVSQFNSTDNSRILNEILELIKNEVHLLNDEMNRELFFRFYNNGNTIEALKYFDKIIDIKYKGILNAVLGNNIDKIIEELNVISVAESSYEYLYYSTHLLSNEYLRRSEILISEIQNYTDIVFFDPLNKLLENLKEEKVESYSIDEDIWQILSLIHSNIEFDETMNAILSAIIKIADLDRAIFFKFTNSDLKPLKGYDSNLSIIDLKNIKVSTTILKDTIKFGEIRFLSNLQEETDFDIHSSIFGLGLRSAVCYPLFINNEIKGVFYADTTGDKKFTDDEKKRIETILIQANSALRKSEMFEEVKKKVELGSLSNDQKFNMIIGNSKPIRDILSVIDTVGEHNVNVLITGPTGSGKELVARSLHKVYGEKKPLISVNCTAIPESLIESELFGYVKGAFTGANTNKKGKIEEAGNGTIFLDEIGDMPLSMQAKLLRVLQERVVTPVGSSKEIKINARFVAATNKNLEELVKKNEFREDLLYRLKVVTIDIPSLNKRREDIPLLINNFIIRFNKKFDKKIKNISDKALSELRSANWNGNIRQLENIIEKAVIFSKSDILDLDLFDLDKNDLTTSVFDEIPTKWSEFKKYKENMIKILDNKYSDIILKEADGNIKKASERAEMNRRQLYRIKRKETD